MQWPIYTLKCRYTYGSLRQFVADGTVVVLCELTDHLVKARGETWLREHAVVDMRDKQVKRPQYYISLI